MNYITMKYFSSALNRYISFEIFMPAEGKRPMKALWLLHGYTMGAYNWIPEQLAEKYNFAIVIPSGENAFWLDGISTGHKYCTFIGCELPELIHSTFGLASGADDTYIMGLSMGGFGALHTALMYPERFGKVCALSSALIVHQVSKMKPGDGNDHANYEYYRECFGEPSRVLESDANPEHLVEKLLSAGQKIPEIYMCCGTEDFLLESNREFHRFLTEKNVPHEYHESAGGHDFTFWNQYIECFIDKIFG